MVEAQFYDTLDEGRVRCTLCPHFCLLKEGETGLCGVRRNVDGRLMSLVYGQAAALHVDPIEKKPLFHVLPGSRSFSMATVGCNFKCVFCQNSDISQVKAGASVSRYAREIAPVEIVTMAQEQRCDSIAYTYTEPTIYYEYAYECCRLAHEQNMLNVFVSNGYINPEPLNLISPFLDGANIDLKSFRNDFYTEFIGAKLNPVLDTIKLMKKLNIWVEVTSLVIPGKNDSEEEMRDIARFIKQEAGVETPWHISRFHPSYQMHDIPPTPLGTLQRAREIGLEEGLRYVYTGNVAGDDGESTFCYSCNELLIKRYGFQLLENNIKEAKCRYCGAPIDGIMR